ncbi:MAG: Crp/Fnr family transcriptional regulator [Magnetovibrionaceae bacterium]
MAVIDPSPPKGASADWRADLRAHALFSGLPEDAFRRLAPAMTATSLGRGELLFQQGDRADRLFFVHEGWIKVYRSDAEGGEAVLHVVGAGETFAEPAALSIGIYPASAEAVAASVVVAIEVAAFNALMDAEPGLARAVISALALRLRDLTDDLSHRELLPTHQRLATFLLSLPEQEGRNHVRLPFDKHLLAARLGMKPESLSRAFGKLKALGVTTEGPLVRISDRQSLQDWLD